MEELIEYMWLRPKITKLNVDIFVDDGLSYVRHNHNLKLFVRNGYDKSANEFIPFLVSSDPVILDQSVKYNITYEDIFSVQEFVSDNLSPLQAVARKEINHTSFIQTIKPNSHLSNEEGKSLAEISIFKDSAANLPVCLWIEAKTAAQKHQPELRFRANHKQRQIHEYSSISLTNPPTIYTPQDTPLKENDIKELRDFVVSNLDSLLNILTG